MHFSDVGLLVAKQMRKTEQGLTEVDTNVFIYFFSLYFYKLIAALFVLKPPAGDFSKVRDPSWSRSLKLHAASICPTAMFLSFALNAPSRDNIVALPLPSLTPPPPTPTMTVSMKVSLLLARLKALAPLHLRV